MRQIELFAGRRAPRKKKASKKPVGAAGEGKVRKLGRGGTRIWLEGLWLLRSGFEAFGEATVLIDREKRRVVLALDPEIADALSSSESTERLQKRISGKVRRGKQIPVIDIERKDLSEVFGGALEVVVESRRGQLVITPSEAEVMRNERLAAEPNNHEVSLYSGAGFLSLAAEQAGYRPVLAVEKWEKAADAFFAAHRRRVAVSAVGVEKLALREMRQPGSGDLPRNPWLLTAGVPCETYSKLGGKGLSVWGKPPRKKGAPVKPTQQIDPHELSDQTFWTLALVVATNPVNVVVENVEGFLRYGGGFVRALQVLGYHVAVAMIDPSDHGYAAGRRRAVVVATTHPGFSFPPKRSRALRGERLKDVLLHPSDPKLAGLSEREGGWFSIKAKKGIGKTMREGKWLTRSSFPATVFEYADERIPAVTKSMHKGSPTGPYLRHPSNRDLYRLLTVEEVERAHGVPLDVAQRIAGAGDGSYKLLTQLYGQGVHVPMFREILSRLPRPAITVEQNPWSWWGRP